MAALAVVLAVASFAGSADRFVAAAPGELRSLHFRITVDQGDDFVFVEAVGGTDVRVRAVRVASTSEYCGIPLVQAVERVLPRTTVASVAKLAVCSMSQQQVDRALKEAPDPYMYIDFGFRIDAVVADCGGVDKEFVFTLPPMVDRKKLARRSPDVSALWNLGERLRAVAFDSRSTTPFETGTSESRREREARGTTIVPDLLAGRYAEYLKPTLTGYTGPPAQREASWVEVIDRASLKLDEYVEPVMPAIAKSARVFGDVRIKLRADAATGAVSDAEVLPGTQPLLRDAALAAVRRWRFAAGAAPDDPVVVTVRFQLRCP